MVAAARLVKSRLVAAADNRGYSALLASYVGRVAPSFGCNVVDDKGASDPMPDDLEEAVVSWLQRQGRRLDCSAYALLLRKCGLAKNWQLGNLVYHHIEDSVHVHDRFLRNLAVEMYGKCGRLEDASQVFRSLACPNVFSWTLMIAAYVQNGHYMEALKTFENMNFQGVKLDKVTFFTVLEACAALADLGRGKHVHTCIEECGFGAEVVLCNTLINMYGKCRSLGDAKSMFDNMENKDSVSWNALITAFTQNGCSKEALALFREMELGGIRIGNVTLTGVLEACANVAGLQTLRDLHSRINLSGFDSEVVVMNTLISMYAKCKRVQESRLVFDSMTDRTVVSWNSMITAHAQAREGWEAIDLLKRMDLEGFQSNEVTFVNVVEACAIVGQLTTGKMVHELAIHAGLDTDHVLSNSLVNMYGKCGRLDIARQVFEDMACHSLVSWNTIIAAYAQNECGREALLLFKEMEFEGIKANPVTFVSVLDACATVQALAEGIQVHDRVVQCGFDAHVVLGTTLVNMYAKCQNFELAKGLLSTLKLDEMVSWNALISGYAQHEHGKQAVDVFRKMDQEGIRPNDVTYVGVLDACSCERDDKTGSLIHARVVATGFDCVVTVVNTVINMYGKCGMLEDATVAFEHAVKEKTADAVTYNVIIAAYAQQDRLDEAMVAFSRMQQDGMGIQEATLVSILDACSGSIQAGRAIHLAISSSPKGICHTEMVNNALVDMYGKSGRVVEARSVFDSIQSKGLVTWTAMLAGYANHGCAKEAVELFRKMQHAGVTPDIITFSRVVFACSHTGLVDDAFGHFSCMGIDYGICPSAEHYSALVDVLARLGRLSEAEELIRTMPFEPDGLAYTSLMSACQVHGEIQRGSQAEVVQFAFELDQESSSANYVLLSNMYAALNYQ